LYLLWWDAEEATPRLPARERLDVLRQALRDDPWNMEILRRLLLAGRRGDDLADKAHAMVKDMLTKGDVPAAAHFLIGTDYLEKGQIPEARRHLEHAHRLDSRSSDAVNNLAWAMAHAQPPDFHGALELLDAGIRADPSHPEMRESRGYVNIRLKRWTEALPDLELCLPVTKDKAGLHALLAEVYEGLGQAELADQHRRQAQGAAGTAQRP
jgi:tetratricopeptide (TPR) repeat protein